MQDTKILMDLDDIAEMYGCTRRHARDVVVKTPGFPPIVPGSTSRNPRWLRAKVEEFLLEGCTTR